jgi:hypothetical protein
MPATHTPMDPEDIPLPLLERGDWVQLAEPYSPIPDELAPGVKEALEMLVEKRARERGDDGLDYPKTLDYASRHGGYEGLFQFTHGTVVEAVTSRPIQQVATSAAHAARLDHAYGERGGPAETVALRLHNPATGLTYMVGTQDTARPEYVDFSTEALILKHKHSDTWGTTYDLPVADVLEQWNVEYHSDLAPNRGEET